MYEIEKNRKNVQNYKLNTRLKRLKTVKRHKWTKLKIENKIENTKNPGKIEEMYKIEKLE